MPFLNNDSVSPTITVKLTNKGRKLIANGFKLDNIFDMVKFSFGDSEIDYGVDSVDILSQEILEPSIGEIDFNTKLYSSGVEPSGTASITLTASELNMSKLQSGKTIGVEKTDWPPVEGAYIERYSWTNLGPLKDYNFEMVTSIDTKTASFRTYETTGSTSIKIYGETSGKHVILTLNIT